MGSLDASWARLERALGAFWSAGGRLGRSRGHVEASWGHFGVSWEDLGGVWGSLGGFLGSLWIHFWKIFGHLEQNVKIAKNLRKPMVFH